MSHSPAAHTSYKSAQNEGESLRETEARALLSCARRLQSACEESCSRDDFGEAIRLNQQLWTIFQAALVDPENQLPTDLRYLLLNLARYVDKVSFRAMAEKPATQLLQSMIQINRNIAAGLNVKTAAPKEGQQQAVPLPAALGTDRESLMTMV